MNQLTVIIERDAEGLFVASVPELHGCHTQAPTIPEALTRIAEAIELCLAENDQVEARRNGAPPSP